MKFEQPQYLYQSHEGGGNFYLSEYDDMDNICEVCGDSDTLIGEVNNETDVIALIASEMCDIDDYEDPHKYNDWDEDKYYTNLNVQDIFDHQISNKTFNQGWHQFITENHFEKYIQN